MSHSSTAAYDSGSASGGAGSPISIAGLTFGWPGAVPMVRELSVTFPPGRTGLVAPNGAGKSTLLRLISGDLVPGSGVVTVAGQVGYLPQTLTFSDELTVGDILGITPVLAAISAIESGDVGEAHFATVGNDWDIADRAAAIVDRLGLVGLSMERPAGSLSGGQVVSLGLAGLLLAEPDVLLLDEPTNNLDRAARERLYALIQQWRGTLLVVSHDRELLDLMDRTAELHAGEIRFFGGNFTAYSESLAAEQEVAQRAVRAAEQQVKRGKREQQLARERAQRRSSTAVRNLADAGLPKIVAGQLKRNAQESAGRADGMHASRVEAAKQRLEAAERAVRQDQVIDLDLPDTSVPTSRVVVQANGINIERGGRSLFGASGVDLQIRGPERVALVGDNGSGKSTLLRLLLGTLEPATGIITRHTGRIAHLSQWLDLLDVERGVLANLTAAAPNLGLTEKRYLLAKFLFTGDAVDLPVGLLSGGERLRATLACVLAADPAPQLLLLDEPTNNLDLGGVAQLVAALRAYRGALVLVCHDERVVREVGIDTRWTLAEGRLQAWSA